MSNTIKIQKVKNSISIFTEYKNMPEFTKVLRRNLKGYTLNKHLEGCYEGKPESAIRLDIDIEGTQGMTERNIRNILDFIYSENQQFSIRLLVNNSIFYPVSTTQGVEAIRREFVKW